MGICHIVCVREDALTLNKNRPDEAMSAIGQGIRDLCLEPEHATTPQGLKRVRSHSVLNHGNGLRHAGEVHSNDETVFIWGGNCLQTLAELDDKQVAGAKRLFDDLYSKRLAMNARSHP